MCAALARAGGGTLAWAYALLHEHPRTFDAFWRSAFQPSPAKEPPPSAAVCDIDEILGRT